MFWILKWRPQVINKTSMFPKVWFWDIFPHRFVSGYLKYTQAVNYYLSSNNWKSISPVPTSVLIPNKMASSQSDYPSRKAISRHRVFNVFLVNSNQIWMNNNRSIHLQRHLFHEAFAEISSAYVLVLPFLWALTACMFDCVRHQLDLIWDNGYLHTFLTHGLPESRKHFLNCLIPHRS